MLLEQVCTTVRCAADPTRWRNEGYAGHVNMWLLFIITNMLEGYD